MGGTRRTPQASATKLGPRDIALPRLEGYIAVSDLMQTRDLLGARGVEWIAPRGRALFVFEPFVYAVPGGLGVLRDVTSDQPAPVPPNRRVALQRYHTYRLTRQ